MLVVSVAIGVTTRLIAGFYRGKFEAVAGFVSDVIMSLPGIVLLIALYALTGPNIPVAMAVFGVIVAPTYYRLVRSVVLGVRNELYVDAARVVGLSDLPHRRPPRAVGGPRAGDHPELVHPGRRHRHRGRRRLPRPRRPGRAPPGASCCRTSFNGIYNNPWAVVWPALVISLTILALVLLGNALSDVLQSSARSKTLPPRRRRQVLARPRATERRAGRRRSRSSPTTCMLSDPRAAHRLPRRRTASVSEVVHGVDLDLRRGEIHGLVGESGSGKSQIAFSTLGHPARARR